MILARSPWAKVLSHSRRQVPGLDQCARVLFQGLHKNCDLRRRGLAPLPTSTPRDFALEVWSALPAKAARAFAALTESYQAERFGGHKSSSSKQELCELRDNLHA